MYLTEIMCSVPELLKLETQDLSQFYSSVLWESLKRLLDFAQ